MAFEFNCHRCRKLLEAEDHWVDKRVQCPACKTVQRVPTPKITPKTTPSLAPKPKVSTLTRHSLTQKNTVATSLPQKSEMPAIDDVAIGYEKPSEAEISTEQQSHKKTQEQLRQKLNEKIAEIHKKSDSRQADLIEESILVNNKPITKSLRKIAESIPPKEDPQLALARKMAEIRKNADKKQAEYLQKTIEQNQSAQKPQRIPILPDRAGNRQKALTEKLARLRAIAFESRQTRPELRPSTSKSFQNLDLTAISQPTSYAGNKSQTPPLFTSEINSSVDFRALTARYRYVPVSLSEKERALPSFKIRTSGKLTSPSPAILDIKPVSAKHLYTPVAPPKHTPSIKHYHLQPAPSLVLISRKTFVPENIKPDSARYRYQPVDISPSERNLPAFAFNPASRWSQKSLVDLHTIDIQPVTSRHSYAPVDTHPESPLPVFTVDSTGKVSGTGFVPAEFAFNHRAYKYEPLEIAHSGCLLAYQLQRGQWLWDTAHATFQPIPALFKSQRYHYEPVEIQNRTLFWRPRQNSINQPPAIMPQASSQPASVDLSSFKVNTSVLRDSRVIRRQSQPYSWPRNENNTQESPSPTRQKLTRVAIFNIMGATAMVLAVILAIMVGRMMQNTAPEEHATGTELQVIPPKEPLAQALDQQTVVATAKSTPVYTLPENVSIDAGLSALLPESQQDGPPTFKGYFRPGIHLARTGELLSLFLDPKPVQPTEKLRSIPNQSQILSLVATNTSEIIDCLEISHSFTKDLTIGSINAATLTHIVAFPVAQNNYSGNRYDHPACFIPGPLTSIDQIKRQFGPPTAQQKWVGQKTEVIRLNSLVHWWGNVGVAAEGSKNITHVLLKDSQ